MGHGVGQAVDPHFDPHLFQRFCNKKASKTEVFDAFWIVLMKKMRNVIQDSAVVAKKFESSSVLPKFHASKYLLGLNQ